MEEEIGGSPPPRLYLKLLDDFLDEAVDARVLSPLYGGRIHSKADVNERVGDVEYRPRSENSAARNAWFSTAMSIFGNNGSTAELPSAEGTLFSELLRSVSSLQPLR